MKLCVSHADNDRYDRAKKTTFCAAPRHLTLTSCMVTVTRAPSPSLWFSSPVSLATVRASFARLISDYHNRGTRYIIRVSRRLPTRLLPRFCSWYPTDGSIVHCQGTRPDARMPTDFTRLMFRLLKQSCAMLQAANTPAAAYAPVAHSTPTILERKPQQPLVDLKSSSVFTGGSLLSKLRR